MRMMKCDWKCRLFLTFFLILTIVLAFFNTPVEAAGNGSSFQIDFIDVGQGDATLVQCDGHYMLVDGGPSDKSRLIYTYLKNRGITYLDWMVASHPDADHVGGLSGALNYASIGTALCSVTSYDTKTFKSFVKYLGKQGKSITVPQCGDTFYLGSASVTVVGPIRHSEEANNNSLVLKVDYGNTSFLLTGDAEEEEEKDIINTFSGLQSTVLKVAHHGSNASTSYRFLRTIEPEYAVISVGADNSYGHPTENTLSKLRDADVKTFRTDMQRDIICTSDGSSVSFRTEKNQDAVTLKDAGLGQNSYGGYNSYTENTSEVERTVIPADTATSSTSGTYILNTNTKKFHYPECSSVRDMKEKNKQVFTGSREEVIANGYVPCKRCNP